MKLSSLAKLLSGQLAACDYSEEISAELKEHTRGLMLSGGVAPVRVTQDVDLLLDRAGLGALCRLFASSEITAEELAYTADALQMAERVEISGEDIATYLAECTDPVINGPLTPERALKIAGSNALGQQSNQVQSASL